MLVEYGGGRLGGVQVDKLVEGEALDRGIIIIGVRVREKSVIIAI